MTYPKVCLRRGEETGVRAGKPWIFENQLDWADDVAKTAALSTCSIPGCALPRAAISIPSRRSPSAS